MPVFIDPETGEQTRWVEFWEVRCLERSDSPSEWMRAGWEPFAVDGGRLWLRRMKSEKVASKP